MSASPQRIIAFRDVVTCTLRSHRATGITLSGWTAEEPSEEVTVSFNCAAREGLPETLRAPLVERLQADRYRISCGPLEWTFQAGSVHVHRETAGAFYRAIPGREPPWQKRLFWRAVLALASKPYGQRLLRAIRR